MPRLVSDSRTAAGHPKSAKWPSREARTRLRRGPNSGVWRPATRREYAQWLAFAHGDRKNVGSIGRVSAPDIEATIIKAVRAHEPGSDDEMTDRALVLKYVTRIEVSKSQLKIEFATPVGDNGAASAKAKSRLRELIFVQELHWRNCSTHGLCHL